MKNWHLLLDFGGCLRNRPRTTAYSTNNGMRTWEWNVFSYTPALPWLR